MIERIFMSFLGCLICSSSMAADFCPGLKAVVAEAKNSFVPLRGNFSFEDDEYRGKVSMGELSECSTESVDGVGRYSCKTDLSDDESAAVQKSQDFAKSIAECLGSDIQRVADRVRKLNFKYRPTNDDISVRYQRIVSKRSGARYIITLSIDTVDLSK